MKKLRLPVVVVWLSIPAIAQTSVTQEERQIANNYFTANDWSNAAKAFQSIADREPQNWNAKMRLGISLSASGKVKEAIPVLEDAVKVGNNGQTMYFLASAFAKAGDKEKAFEWFDKALTNGFSLLTAFENDAGFAALKSDARYEQLYDRLKKGVYPCRYAKESREFDFWIGEWDVKNPQGQPAGKSKIELILGDCVIFENWTSNPPAVYSGKSFNLYNSSTKKWMQTWVDDKGVVTEFVDGEYKDNKMAFVTKPNTQNQITRLTFHNLGLDLVRQHAEVTNDDGKTWTTSYDLYYHRVK